MPIGTLDDLPVCISIEPMCRESETDDHLLLLCVTDLGILADIANQLHTIDGGIMNAVSGPILGLEPGRLVHRSVGPGRLTRPAAR